MNTIHDVLNLLAKDAPLADVLPERIEELNLASFDVSEHIRELTDETGQVEEDATAEAAVESNADRRKVRRAEILRDDDRYSELQAQVRAAERVRLRLDERAHRYSREYRAHLLNREINYLGRRQAA